MNPSLIVLFLAAFALVAITVSAAVSVALPLLDRLALWMSPRQRARLWLSVAALPAAAGLLIVGLSFLPSVGFGDDHCIPHGLHHPHLCADHIGSPPGLVLIALALLVIGRAVHGVISVARGVYLSSDVSGALREASDRYVDALVFPAEAPKAFVLGAFRPQLYISSGLLALGAEIVEPILSHERVHAGRRDPLWRAFYPVLAFGHLPGTTSALADRLVTAQEFAADSEAADTPGNNRFRIAQALIIVARLSLEPSPGVSFTQGNIEARVRALLCDDRAAPRWPLPLLAVSSLLTLGGIGASRDLIHHSLELLLGALS